MNIRKAVVFPFLALIALPCICYAVPTASISLTSQMCEVVITDTIDTKYANSAVNLYVSGDKYDELKAVSPVLVYADQKTVSDEGEYSFDFLLSTSVCGRIPYIIKTIDNSYSDYINVVSYDDGKKLVSAITDGGDADTVLLLGDFEPYIDGIDFTSIDKEKLAAELIASGTVSDVPSLISAIKHFSIVPMLNCGYTDIFSNSKLRYPSELGLEDGDCAIYAGQISETGLKNIMNGILVQNFADESAVLMKLRQLLYVNCITNNSVQGVNGTADIITSYSALLGIDVNRYYNCTDKSAAIKGLVGSGAGDVESFIEKYNELFPNRSIKNTGGKGSSSRKAAMPYTVAVSGDDDSIDTFTDMHGFEWAREAVHGLKKAAVISGKTNTTFAPSDNVTREEFVAMAVRLLGLAGSESTSLPFYDTDPQQWYYASLAAGYNAGIITGYDRKMGVGENVTREDIATILLRVLKVSGLEGFVEDIHESDFIDEKYIDDYALEAVHVLKDLGIVSGYPDGSFMPHEFSNRAESAHMLYKAKIIIDKFKMEETD